MNQDYHYSATYLASRRAGFSEEDSDTIAWAALMVDEMTKEQYKKMNYLEYKAEITAYEYSETIALIFGLNHAYIHGVASEELNLNDKEFIGILEDTVKSEFEVNAQLEREIWIPFHFLPGNLMKKDNGQGKEEWV